MTQELQISDKDWAELGLRGGEIEIANLEEAKATFDKRGTARVITGRRFGVSVKDEGDFISIRFGSIELTPIGGVPTGERNFATKQEAFEFVRRLQSQIIQPKQVGSIPRHGGP